jgi:hypothetical protein
MKRKTRIIALLITLILCLTLVLAGCKEKDEENGPGTGPGSSSSGVDANFPSEAYVYPTGPRGEGVEIVIYGWNDELSTAMARYKEMNPDFLYTFRPVTHFTDWDGSYETGLNAALLAGGADAPDVFFVESAFVVNYTQYDYAHYALPYSELLGVNVKPLIQSAEISQFIVDAGTNPDGSIVGLGFQHTGSGFIYRRDLAEQIWGDGSLEAVAAKVGPGWDKFLEAAAEADAAGISMLSDMVDAWQAIRNSPNPWIVDGKMVIDAQRMSYLDIGKTLYQGGYTNEGGTWNDNWFADMSGTGARPVLGFLGPAWLINYVLAGNSGDSFGKWGLVAAPDAFAWGGTWSIVNKNASAEKRAGLAELIHWLKLDTTDNGFLYQFGGGTLYDNSAIDYDMAKDMVSSQVVQRRLDPTLDFLGGQDMSPTFIEAGRVFTTKGWGPHDRTLNNGFSDWAMEYFQGNMTRDEMLAAFKQNMLDEHGIES